VATLRFPPSVWDWRATVSLGAVIVTPLLVMLLLAPELRSFADLITTTQLVIYPAILGAGVLLYIHYRVTDSAVLAWLTLCMTMFAVEAVALAGLRAGDPDLFFGRAGWVPAVDLPVAVLILAAVRAADKASFPVDPLLIGLLLGLVFAGLRLTANAFGPELAITSPPALVIEALLVGVGLATAHAAGRLRGIPRWSAIRLCLGTVALVVHHIVSFQDMPGAIIGCVAVVTGIVGAVLMVSASAAGLRFAIQQQRGSLTTLAEHVAELQADERENRARLNEITNSISGIAVASSLIYEDSEVPAPKRRKLEQMLDTESNRLARVLARVSRDRNPDPALADQPPAPGDPQLIDLDRVLGPLVSAQRSAGRRVRWQPGGVTAVGDPDAVAELVGILLENAAQHAPDSDVSIDVSRRGNTVEIAVHDDGPGVPSGMSRQLFEWSGRGAEPDEHGIGLHLAHDTIRSGGNSLRLADDGTGVTFVIGLPARTGDQS
jgi:signal transduction histidine kinase